MLAFMALRVNKVGQSCAEACLSLVRTGSLLHSVGGLMFHQLFCKCIPDNEQPGECLPGSLAHGVLYEVLADVDGSFHLLQQSQYGCKV